MLTYNWVLPTDTGFVGKIKISIIAIYDFLKQVCDMAMRIYLATYTMKK